MGDGEGGSELDTCSLYVLIDDAPGRRSPGAGSRRTGFITMPLAIVSGRLSRWLALALWLMSGEALGQAIDVRYVDLLRRRRGTDRERCFRARPASAGDTLWGPPRRRAAIVAAERFQ